MKGQGARGWPQSAAWTCLDPGRRYVGTMPTIPIWSLSRPAPFMLHVTREAVACRYGMGSTGAPPRAVESLVEEPAHVGVHIDAVWGYLPWYGGSTGASPRAVERLVEEPAHVGVPQAVARGVAVRGRVTVHVVPAVHLGLGEWDKGAVG